MALSDVDENNYQRIAQYNISIQKKEVNKQESNNQRLYPQYDDQTRIVHSIKQHRKRLTKDKIQQIIDGYRNGATVYELAAQFNCHRDTISKSLKRNGIQPTIELDLDIQKVIALYNDGEKITDIARKFNVGDSSIRRRLVENGAKMRSRWDYQECH